MNLQFIGIIPARYNSERFPGKPLAKIGSKTMIRRVYEQATRILDTVIVATDDHRIEKEVKYFEGEVIMTSPDHKTGTERCAEAYKKYVEESGMQFDVIINIQGDEPFISPKEIKTLMNCFLDKNIEIATLIRKISDIEEVLNPHIVKAVVTRMGYALYFSRTPIPFVRDLEQDKWLENYKFFKHLGIYAYKPKALTEITRLAATQLELAEKLEQNRWLENEFTIKTATTEYDTISVDVPEDIQKIIDAGLIDDEEEEIIED